ncbi:MAG: pyrimidine reductase [Gammaproteobacteria bacterium]|nr:pyrimidine reductase [Gammaproteobacteria bacterium]
MTEPAAAAPSEHDALGLQMLYPRSESVPLSGLYLGHDLRSLLPASGSFVYSNFITSLDGRIALPRAGSTEHEVPKQTANPRDWRLLLELAAPADAIIVSGRLLRELETGMAQAWPAFSDGGPEDLLAFRTELGMPEQPALVVVSRSLDLPRGILETLVSQRRVIVAGVAAAASQRADAVQAAGVELLRLGDQAVDARDLIDALSERSLRLIYSTAGPEVLHLLLRGQVLQRLYLTMVARVLAGSDFATLVHGPRLEPPCDFSLRALYFDPAGAHGVGQLLQVYDRCERAGRAS